MQDHDPKEGGLDPQKVSAGEGEEASTPEPGLCPIDSLSKEELVQRVEELVAEVDRLRHQRDKARKSRDAVIAQVLPITAGAQQEPAGKKRRGVFLILCVLLVLAVVLLVEVLPRFVQRMNQRQRLPDKVRVMDESEAAKLPTRRPPRPAPPGEAASPAPPGEAPH